MSHMMNSLTKDNVLTLWCNIPEHDPGLCFSRHDYHNFESFAIDLLTLKLTLTALDTFKELAVVSRD